MKTLLSTTFLLFILAIMAFVPTPGLTRAETELHLTILHINDVYEITPVSGGKLGGLARIATLKKQLLAQNPNTILTFGGDLYGPSGLSNAAIVDGKPLAGKQAVAVMNTVGVNYATFGDHEFDQFSAEQVLARMAETKYPMISSNLSAADGNPFPGVARNTIFTVTNSAGDAVRVGLFAVSEPIVGGSKLTVTYQARITATAEQVAALDGQSDILIALTHFGVKEDIDTAQRFPQIDLILGGDDHDHMKVEPGAGLPPIFKSASNARNVQIIDLYFDTATGALRIEDRLQAVTNTIAEDPTTKAEVDKWLQIGFAALRTQGLEPTRVIVTSTIDLDGFATSVRRQPTPLTNLILAGINDTAAADVSILTSGLLRLDDLIPAGGAFTEYDVVRTFPNNLPLIALNMPGAVLSGTLAFGARAAGSGSYILATDNVSRTVSGQWLIDGQPLNPGQTYRVGASVAESYLTGFGATLVQTYTNTLRQVLIEQLEPDMIYLPAIRGGVAASQ